MIDRCPDGLPELSGFAPTEWLTSLVPLEVVETERASGLIWGFVALLGVTVRSDRRPHPGGGSEPAPGRLRRAQGPGLRPPPGGRGRALAVHGGRGPGPGRCPAPGPALGRWSWRAFAQLIGVIDTPVVPVLSLVAVAVGALVASSLVAAVPAAVAGRTSPATALRQE